MRPCSCRVFDTSTHTICHWFSLWTPTWQIWILSTLANFFWHRQSWKKCSNDILIWLQTSEARKDILGGSGGNYVLCCWKFPVYESECLSSYVDNLAFFSEAYTEQYVNAPWFNALAGDGMKLWTVWEEICTFQHNLNITKSQAKSEKYPLGFFTLWPTMKAAKFISNYWSKRFVMNSSRIRNALK